MSLLRTTALCGMLVAFSALSGAEALAPVALNRLSGTPGAAASAKVLDQNGRLLGQVERIQTDQYGKPSALAFRAANGNTVVISAAAVGFNGSVLVVSNDQPQIVALLQPQRTAAAE
jgi:hypothetical protein